MMRWFWENRALAPAMPPRATCSLSAVWKATSVCVGGVKRNCPVHVNVNANMNTSVNANVMCEVNLMCDVMRCDVM